jgi:hypothetical protein
MAKATETAKMITVTGTMMAMKIRGMLIMMIMLDAGSVIEVDDVRDDDDYNDGWVHGRVGKR